MQEKRHDTTKSTREGEESNWEWTDLYQNVSSVKTFVDKFVVKKSNWECTDKLRLNSIDTWEQLQRKFCENFCGVLTHPSTRIELRTCKQKLDESFQEYYRHFAELRAQFYDITEREVIEHFANGIKYKWQFERFCDDNLETADDFKRTVQKMISSEERTREWFPNRNQQDNRGYEPRGNQGGQSRVTP